MQDKVISRNQLPTRLPVSLTIAVTIALDIYKAPQWLWGVFIALFAIAWAVCVYNLVTEQETDVFK